MVYNGELWLKIDHNGDEWYEMNDDYRWWMKTSGETQQ